jgi:excisionase family DNA binding protein
MLSPLDRLILGPAKAAEIEAIEAATAATIEASQTAMQAAAPAPLVPASQPSYLNVSAAAKALGLDPRSVQTLIENGRLPAVDAGNGKRHHYRIKADDLAKLQSAPHVDSPSTDKPTRSRRRHNGHRSIPSTKLADLFPRA